MSLLVTLGNLTSSLQESKQLAADAQVWASTDWSKLNSKIDQIRSLAERSSNSDDWSTINWQTLYLPANVTRFTPKHKDLVTKFAFFQTFLTWEIFLEESFIDYLMGESLPRGSVVRLITRSPSSRDDARRMAIPPGRPYADWTTANNVINNASRFFGQGKPYSVLTSQQGTLSEIKIIRNSIAHSSESSQRTFKQLVRRKLGSYPSGLTKGGFLAMTVPGYSPPISFFEYYCSTFSYLASKIIPN